MLQLIIEHGGVKTMASREELVRFGMAVEMVATCRFIESLLSKRVAESGKAMVGVIDPLMERMFVTGKHWEIVPEETARPMLRSWRALADRIETDPEAWTANGMPGKDGDDWNAYLTWRKAFREVHGLFEDWQDGLLAGTKGHWESGKP
jgi:hypothetical protein